MTQATESPTRNGWNLDDFHGAVAMVKDKPEAGKVVFRGRVRWDGGFGGDARAEEIEQLGQAIPRRFTLRGDHPPELLGQNTGATAVETLLAALGACVMGTYAAHATARGIALDSLEVEVEGGIDLGGFFRIAPVPPRLSGVSVKVRVAADAEEAVLEELLRITTEASPVFDTVSHPVAVRPELEVAR